MDGTPKSREGNLSDHNTTEMTSPAEAELRESELRESELIGSGQAGVVSLKSRTLASSIRNLAPGVMTMTGLFMAFWSMTLTADGRYEQAVWAIFIAGVCDTFDGTLARALGVISALGRQLDSLVDLVAAGVAPAMLIYRVYFESWGLGGLVLGFAWAALVALRLARFTTSTSTDGAFFVGIPCPIAAGIVSQYLLFSRATWGNDGHAWVCALLVVGLGALMLSRVPYWKSTTLMPKNYLRYPYGPGTTVVLLLLIPFPQQSLFAGALFSVLAAVVLRTIRGMRTKQHPAPALSTVATVSPTRSAKARA